jgi:hypothetical protein
MNQTRLKQIQQNLIGLSLTESQKEYILNCDDDGILTKKDATYLKQIGKWITMETVLN